MVFGNKVIIGSSEGILKAVDKIYRQIDMVIYY